MGRVHLLCMLLFFGLAEREEMDLQMLLALQANQAAVENAQQV